MQNILESLTLAQENYAGSYFSGRIIYSLFFRRL